MDVSHNVRICQAMFELGFEYSRFSKRLVRTYAGFTLGDNVSAFETSEKGRLLGTDEIGGKIYFFSTRDVSSELVEKILYYWHDQLALIKLKYSGSYSGGWKHLVEQTTEKYGPPSREGCRRAIWNDGQTVLILDHDLAAYITASLGDLAFVLKYLDLQKSSAAKLSKYTVRYRDN
jgi:hypothetical protein